MPADVAGRDDDAERAGRPLAGAEITPIGAPSRSQAETSAAATQIPRAINVAGEVKIADEQRALLEAEAQAHEELGAAKHEELLDVGARVVDELEPLGGDGTVERHPSV